MRLTDEQRQYRESIARVLDGLVPFDARQKASKSDTGFSRDLWRQAADLGWLGAGLPEEAGGLSGGPAETGLLFAELGRRLVTGPWLATLGLAAPALMAANAEVHLEGVAEGKAILTFAHQEAAARHDLSHVETRASRSGRGFKLDGVKCLVPFAGEADRILVSARTSGKTADADALSLFLLAKGAKGMTVKPFRTHDGGRAGEVVLNGAEATLVCETREADPAIRYALDHAAAMQAMAAQGSMWAVYEMTLAYFKTRKQFGQTLGSFQALQHRLVDVYVKCQLAQSMAEDAVMALYDSEPGERSRRVSAAKAYVGESGRAVGKEGVQLHGGIGMTDDYPVGHHMKQLTAMALTNGDADWHMARFERLSAEGGNA
jgi:alkylation response protein AidB-like acyl-CoA dehydrogenase